MGIKILAAFSNLLLSEGVSRLLEEDGDLEVSLHEAARVCSREHSDSFDVILTDLFTLNNSFPDLDTSKRNRFILFDTGCDDDTLVSTIVSRNLSGVLLAPATPEMLKKAVRAVARGDVWIDRTTVKDLLQGVKALKPDALSARENAVVELAGTGLRNREIAGRLGISELTVKAHLHRIFKKLKIGTRSQLITYSIRKAAPESGFSKKPAHGRNAAADEK